MSVEMMARVFKCNMPELKTDKGEVVKDSSCKFVLLALADHASEDGEGCYPGVRKICRKTNLSIQTVVNALNALRHNGFTRLEGQSKRHTFNYTVLVSRIVEFQWVEQSDSIQQNSDVLPDRANPSIEPSIKPSSAPAARPLDLVDGLLKYQKPVQTIRQAIHEFFRFNVNWETKTARQWMEWATGEQITPEQIQSASDTWRNDKRFNWSTPTLQKIFEQWPALMGESEYFDPLLHSERQQEIHYIGED